MTAGQKEEKMKISQENYMIYHTLFTLPILQKSKKHTKTDYLS